MAPTVTEDTPLVSKSDDGNDADKFRELQHKWFMRSKTGSWTAFLLCCWTQCITACPLLGWQTLQQNMINEGCPYNKVELDDMDTCATALGVAACLPIGLVFDHYGPWIIGNCGVFFGGLSMCGMGLALLYSDSMYWLLGPAYTFSYIFALMNYLGTYSYLWILGDEKRFTVSALLQASDALAVTGVLLSFWLTASYGVTTGAFFMGLGLLSCASTTISWFAYPTCGDAKLLKHYALSMTACEDEEKPSIDDIFGAKEDGGEQNQTVAQIARQQLADVMCIACQQHPVDVWLFFSNTFMLYIGVFTLLVNQYAYYLSMFPEETSIYLVYSFLYFEVFVGPVVAVCQGLLFDQIGTGCAIAFGNCVCVVYLILNALPYEASIITSMVVFTGSLSYVRMINMNFSQHYAPPELLGTLSGCIRFSLGVGQIIFQGILSEITLVIFSEQSYWKYGVQFLTCCVGAVLTGSLMLYVFNFKHPIKKRGVASYAELHEFQSQAATIKPMEDSSSL